MTGYSPEDALDQLVENPSDFIQRAAAPVVAAHVQRLENQLREQQVTANQDRVQRALDADPQLAGKWRTLNEDPGFLAWLDEVDVMSSEQRLSLLHRAYHRGDGERVKNFFRAYLAQQFQPSSRTEHRLPFEAGRSRPSVSVSEIDRRRVWRRDEIAGFYNDVRAGKYAGREAERLRIEAEIIAAAREHRVLNPPPRGK